MNIAVLADIGRAIPEHVACLLEQDIVLGVLAPNMRLTEEEVAATYGVSRSPVREGLRLLERDGLVRRSARRGIWVAPLSLKDFDEVYCCRGALEALAAEEAARSPGASAAASRFASLLERLRAAQSAADARAFFQADVEGSELIYWLTGNATLRRLLTSLEKQALRYRFFAYAQSPKVVQLSVDGTERIYGHIQHGQDVCAKELTAHLIHGIWQMMRPVITSSFPSGA